MSEQIAQRIIRDLGGADLVDLLSDKLSGAELHSLLLTVLKRRVGKIESSHLARPNAVTQPCELDGRLLNEVERVSYSVAPHFEAIELSPLVPLGTIATLTGLDQGNVLSSIRAFECAADPTVGLALECVRRRKDITGRKETSRLCASQRVVRFPAPKKVGLTAHFKLFSMVSAARDTGSFSFETAALREHIGSYLSLLARLAEMSFRFEDVEVELSDTRVVAHLCSAFGISRDEIRASVRARDYESSERLIEKLSGAWPSLVASPWEDLAQFNLPKHLIIQLGLLEQDVCAQLREEREGVRLSFNLRRLTGLGYYEGPCFHIKAKNDRGESFALADGGFVKWTQRLLGDSKERLMTSAIGAELMCRMFRRS
ncbi:MAG TPA: ATP phosphoribosyltransferase regulatory subunit [Blastocatellia bacterium]